jgi:non-specific serine/threonine protein kinase
MAEQNSPAGFETLPRYLTTLVGRESELRLAAQLLVGQRERLVTLTGPGGVGKTRLAARVASDARPAFPDGIWFVSLASIASPDRVVTTIAEAIDIRETGTAPLDRRLRDFLCDRNALLVLDNFEHVLDAATEIADLLAYCPQLSVLATSRTRLHLSGEHELPLAPLPLPQFNARRLDALAHEPAVVLFLDRARGVLPGFIPTAETAGAIVEICRRLDGLPLALELAAARLKLFSPAALLEQLDRPLAVLTGGPRDLPPRQRSLRDTVAWSYQLLRPHEQSLFRRLAIFATGWTIEAAGAVCPDEPDLLDGLAELADQALIARDDTPGDTARFRMLVAIRAYGLEQLDAAGERHDVALRHARFVLALAQRSVVSQAEAEQGRYDQLDRGRDDVRAALAFATDELADDDLALRLATALYGFWYVRGPVSEGQRWLERALQTGSAAAPELRATALYQCGELARVRGDTVRAATLARHCLRLAHEHDLTGQAAQATFLLGNIAVSRDTFDEAVAHFEAALAISQARGDTERVAMTLTNLGQALRRMGDMQRARAQLEQALPLWDASGSSWGRAIALMGLGEIARDTGMPDRAAPYFRDSLRIFRTLHDDWGIADCLDGLAEVAFARGQPQRAAQLMAVSEALLTNLGIVPSESEQRRRARIHPGAAAASSAVAEVQVPVDQDRLDDTIAEALRDDAGHVAAVSESSRLTERELEILRLIAAGRSNKEIAGTLFLSIRTVERHITNLYAKIDAHGKADATAWAFRHGIS